jgi:hypothetical protein
MEGDPLEHTELSDEQVLNADGVRERAVVRARPDCHQRMLRAARAAERDTRASSSNVVGAPCRRRRSSQRRVTAGELDHDGAARERASVRTTAIGRSVVEHVQEQHQVEFSPAASSRRPRSISAAPEPAIRRGLVASHPADADASAAPRIASIG